MNFCVLGSGSKGNCTYVESDTTSLLIDAGFSGKEITRRLALIDRSPEDLNAILVTHEHGDHISGVGVLSRRYNLPVYANAGTHKGAEKRVKQLHRKVEFDTGEKFRVGTFAIHPFRISHDTRDPVGFVIKGKGLSLAYCTDTGRITKLIQHHVCKCHALILEANHDPTMLKDGPYPLPLKQRVKSNQGHLANEEAARFLAGLAGSPLQYVVLAHLSETNNLPQLVQTHIHNELRRQNISYQILMASQAAPTPLLSLASLK
jgi:phosphoribosyl 1,2-cyclic phosphodiesterase